MKQILPDKVYNVLKYITIIGLPAVTTFFMTIGKIWNIPYTSEIGATLVAITTLIGALICISSIQYHYSQGDKDYVESDNDE